MADDVLAALKAIGAAPLRLGNGAIQARCPACAATGHDNKGEHLRIEADGKFGCAVCAGDHEAQCDKALADLQSDLDSGAVVIVPVDWADVHHTAERLSSARTKAAGHRALNILHVATALHLETKEFLSFDDRQSALAAAEGLAVKP